MQFEAGAQPERGAESPFPPLDPKYPDLPARGHGRSSQPWDSNEMDTYAEDLATLVENLNLNDAIHVGHSTGGGEVARYIGRHGTKRVAKAVLIGAVPPTPRRRKTWRGSKPTAGGAT
jgi:non-heme chloroperoxidase